MNHNLTKVIQGKWMENIKKCGITRSNCLSIYLVDKIMKIQLENINMYAFLFYRNQKYHYLRESTKGFVNYLCFIDFI
jgi:hypothetical protein